MPAARSVTRRTSDVAGRCLATILTTAIALIPFWIYLLTRSALHPEGFWQNFFLIGVGVYLLGFVQLMLIIGLLGFLVLVVWA